MKIAIIGAGAAGCFCAIQLKRELKDACVEVLEAAQKPLMKVAVTGGGRCNLTNTFRDVRSLQQVYPRGHKLMQRLFHQFDQEQLMAWFEAEGVRLTVQPDQCVFPVSQDAMQIVHTLLNAMEREGVILSCGQRVQAISSDSASDGGYLVTTERRQTHYDAVVVTAGGQPKLSGMDFLQPLALRLETPVPSLFTFKIDSPITELMGIVVENTVVSLAGTKMKASGPLLITHWGMSGPAILKLSSHAARHLSEQQYKGQLIINWLGDRKEEEVRAELETLLQHNPQKQIGTLHLSSRQALKSGATSPITTRLWHFLLSASGIAPERRCAEVGHKQLNRLVTSLTANVYSITGQSRFKEEFVTCGGVALDNVNPNTLECRQHPALYFAGEVLDVDAVTGGFNLQAAWTMGFCVATAIGQKSTESEEVHSTK